MRLVTLASYYEPTQAWIAINELKAEGIHAVLENEALLQNVWILGQAVGHLRLCVLETDQDRAKQILADRPTIDASDLVTMAVEAVPDEESKPIFQNFYKYVPDDDSDPYAEATAVDLSEGIKSTDREVELNEREKLIERAFRGAFVSFFFFPLSVFVTIVLFRIMLKEEPISSMFRKKLFWAFMINLPLFLVVLLFLRSIVEICFYSS